jgi:hypothetical protein
LNTQFSVSKKTLLFNFKVRKEYLNNEMSGKGEMRRQVL